MMEELWEDIEGYKGLYRISNLGRVWSCTRTTPHGHHKEGRFLAEADDGHAYLIVNLCRDGDKKVHYIHKLVSKAFVDKREGKTVVRHKDGVKANNKAENLEMCTHAEIMRDAHKMGLIDKKGEAHHRAKLKNEDIIEIRRLLEAGHLKQATLGRMFGVGQGAISKIKVGDRWKHV